MSVILPQSLQQGIQESLPVIPNNGNPGGVYNAPSSDGIKAAQQLMQQQGDPNAWIQPSPWMKVVGNIMDNWDDLIFKTIKDTTNPQTKENYNIGVQNNALTWMPVNDYGEPSSFEDDGTPYQLPIPMDTEQQQQMVPLP